MSVEVAGEVAPILVRVDGQLLQELLTLAMVTAARAHYPAGRDVGAKSGSRAPQEHAGAGACPGEPSPSTGHSSSPVVSGRLATGWLCFQLAEDFAGAQQAVTQVSIQELVAIWHDTLADNARRWIGGGGGHLPQQLDVSLCGMAVHVLDSAAHAAAAAARTPEDLDAEGRTSAGDDAGGNASGELLARVDLHLVATVGGGRPNGVCLQVDAQELAVAVSPHILRLLLGSIRGLLRAVKAARSAKAAASGPAAPAAPLPPDSLEGCSDDLRSGIFAMSAVCGERPRPCEVTMSAQQAQRADDAPVCEGEDRAEREPPAGEGTTAQWVAWRYPYPRRVVAIVLPGPMEDGPEVLHGRPERGGAGEVHVFLERFDEARGSFVEVPTSQRQGGAGRLGRPAHAGEGGMGTLPGHVWISPVGSEGRAQQVAREWRLSWRGDGVGDAKEVLQGIWLNPQRRIVQWGVPPTWVPVPGPQPEGQSGACPGVPAGPVPNMAPLVTPFTLVVRVAKMKIAWLAAHAVLGLPAGAVGEAACVWASELEASLHFWSPRVLAARATGSFHSEYTNAATQTQAVLTEPCQLTAAVDLCRPPPPSLDLPDAGSTSAPTTPHSAGGPSPPLSPAVPATPGTPASDVPWCDSPTGSRHGEAEVEQTADGEEEDSDDERVEVGVDAEAGAGEAMMEEDAAGVPMRSKPCTLGLRVSLRADTALTVRLSEDVLRQGRRAQAASQGRGAGQAPRGGTEGGVVLVENLCPVLLLFGQVGMPEALRLPPGTSRAYAWCAPPALCPGARRLLRLQAAGGSRDDEAELMPPEEMAAPEDATGAGGGGRLQTWWWSAGFDPERAGSQALRLPLGERLSTIVVVQVELAAGGLRWHVRVRPSVVAVNYAPCILQLLYRPLERGREAPAPAAGGGMPAGVRAPALVSCHKKHVQLTAAPRAIPSDAGGSGMGRAGETGAAAQSNARWMDGTSSRELMLVEAAAGAEGWAGASSIEVWLGGRAGWSQRVTLASRAEGEAQDAGEVGAVLLRGAGAEEGGPGARSGSSEEDLEHRVWCRLSPATVQSPFIRIDFLPGLILRNMLPMPLRARFDPGGGAGATEVEVMASGAAPLLASALGGGTVSLQTCWEGEARGAEKGLGAWTQPMLTPELAAPGTRRVDPGKLDLIQAACFDARSRLPNPGSSRSVHLSFPAPPGSSGTERLRAVQCMLCAETEGSGGAGKDGVPGGVVTVLPYALVKNRTPFYVALALASGSPARGGTKEPLVVAGPGQDDAVFDWGAARGALRGRRLLLGVQDPAHLMQGDASTSTSNDGGDGSKPGTRKERSGPEAGWHWGLPGGGAVVLEENASVRVRVCREGGADYLLLVKTEMLGESRVLGAHQAVAITVLPWAVVSNMSSYSLMLRPLTSRLAPTGEASGSSRQTQGDTLAPAGSLGLVPCPPGAAAVPLFEWRAPESSTATAMLAGGAAEEGMREAAAGGDTPTATIAETELHRRQGLPSALDPAVDVAFASPGAADSAAGDRSHEAATSSYPQRGHNAFSGACWRQAGGWAAAELRAAQGRRRLLMPAAAGSGGLGGGAGVVMLTQRVLESEGQAHLLLFRDAQPPAVLHNCTGVRLEVGCAAGGGVLPVLPGQRMDCDWRAVAEAAGEGGKRGGTGGVGVGGLEDGEAPLAGSGEAGGEEDLPAADGDEEALLEQHTAPAPALRLRIRRPGARWSPPFTCHRRVTPGAHAKLLLPPTGASSGADAPPGAGVPPRAGGGAGTGAAFVVRASAVHRGSVCYIQLRRGEQSPLGARIPSPTLAVETGEIGRGAEAGSSGGAAAVEAPMGGDSGNHSLLDVSLRCHLQQLQLSFWDDERRWLRGLTGDADGAPAEVGSITVGGAQCALTVRREVEPAGGGCGAVCALVGSLSAERLQVHNFLPDREFAVILDTALLPVRRQPSPRSALHREPPAPLHAALDLRWERPGAGVEAPSTSPARTRGEAVGKDSSGEMLARCWVRRVKLRAPQLLVHVDDSLVALAERLWERLGPSPGSAGTATARRRLGGWLGRGGGRGERKGPSSGPETGVPQGGRWGTARPDLQQAWAERVRQLSGPRLYLERLEVGQLEVLADVHISGPVALDTRQTPLALSRLHAHGLLYHPQALAHAVAARCLADLILNAAGVVGSLELLFNPTGLVHNVSAGVHDLLTLPLAALANYSPPQFISGLGLGSLSLARHTADWTLTSIAGFSLSIARILRSQRSRQRVELTRKGRDGKSIPSTTVRAAGASCAEGGGLAGRSRTPKSSWGLWGIGTGLASVVTRPVSSALELVAHTSQGLLHVAGINDSMRREADVREGRTEDVALPGGVPWSRCWHWRITRLLHELDAGEPHMPLSMAAHAQWEALSTSITTGMSSATSADFRNMWAVQRPVVVLHRGSLLLLEYGGCFKAAQVPAEMAVLAEYPAERRFTLSSMSARAWRRHISRAQAAGDGFRVEMEHWHETWEGSVQIEVCTSRSTWRAIVPALRTMLNQLNAAAKASTGYTNG
ncbi:hypothetical protein CYMTET_6588 [Cymbomonas tetramitiformis]|uniref:Vacuolar protein sorting-associated protein 13 VPS13 adaptor binding domain-containing protein n=1 Tax=Cymbomonas tetramitiformis TaxID=36881 RepID=A0AAE0GX44_9CHLO|nr:hypothetical protein CYMTET_6588 [Cymbomonas tetramitiformis]